MTKKITVFATGLIAALALTFGTVATADDGKKCGSDRSEQAAATVSADSLA